MLCGNGRSSRIIYNSLANHPDTAIVCVILEDSPSAVSLIKGRIKRLGPIRVAGQLIFQAYNKILNKTSSKRISQLIQEYSLKDEPLPERILKRVASVNSPETIDTLRDINPDVVIVNGTRIISEAVIASIDCPFINTHMGITPKYRGVHGGYWALANSDKENCGVTVHLVDKGIDTGGVLYQDAIHPDQRDNFNTYPIHQIAKAIPLLKKTLSDIRKNQVATRPGITPSTLWYHPTIFEYWKTRLTIGVK